MMYGVARDLQRCMADPIQFREEDVLEVPLLEPANNVHVASPTPVEEAMPLDEPQEALVTATCPLTCKDQAPKCESVARLGETATEPQDMQTCPVPPPGFRPPPPRSEPPPLEEDKPLIGIPDPEESWVALMPIRAINLIILGNNLQAT